jgi:hypothetical protein
VVGVEAEVGEIVALDQRGGERAEIEGQQARRAARFGFVVVVGELAGAGVDVGAEGGEIDGLREGEQDGGGAGDASLRVVVVVVDDGAFCDLGALGLELPGHGG